MSEKQAKKERKNTPETTPVAKKSIFTPINIVIAVVIVAVLALGAWATYDKILESRPAPQTVGTAAETDGLSVEEFLEKCGLSDAGFDADTEMEEFFEAYTVANHAKYEGLSVEELLEKYGFADMPEDTLWQDATKKIKMSVMAELEGYEFEEYKTMVGLPDEVTADTTYEDALAIFQKAASESQN